MHAVYVYYSGEKFVNENVSKGWHRVVEWLVPSHILAKCLIKMRLMFHG